MAEQTTNPNPTAVKSAGFGTAPVFFTAISTILGAILFLKFGEAVGMVGFVGALLIIIVGHLVTIPTALAISEIATNKKVEGGGEYYIISRSFGLNIGSTIGIALYLSQAISVAFYIVAFAEAFGFLYDYAAQNWDIMLPKQVVSIPAMLGLSALILKKGADLGVKALYIVVAVLAVSLLAFFLGTPTGEGATSYFSQNGGMRGMGSFFVVFAFVFPAFTGMTAGVGLSGDLKDPSKSIPLGTTAATIAGAVIYVFIAWKLASSASASDLTGNGLVMQDIAKYGIVLIPLGLIASTLSSAIGSVMVAPRTLQALGQDKAAPVPGFNRWVAKGKGEKNEPFNATLLTCIIAIVFVALGDVEAIANILTMFFMVTYGAICLISFLYHFGADPSYRPVFKSRWYISLLGFIMCVWLMVQINFVYFVIALVLMVLMYLYISSKNKDRDGLMTIFRGAFFQLSRSIMVFLQRSDANDEEDVWRPSAICISRDSFRRDKALDFMSWLAHRYGFGLYVHLVDGYFSKDTHEHAQERLDKLIQICKEKKSRLYLDTIISPSYTSAVAQTIQLPSMSGKENNMVVFEYDKSNPGNLAEIVDNYNLTKAGNYDICILGSSQRAINHKEGIHIWINSFDYENVNLMILLSYIIMGHPDWRKAPIKVFEICAPDKIAEREQDLLNLIKTGRLPISEGNVEFIAREEGVRTRDLVNVKSSDAGFVIIGFLDEQVKHRGTDLFMGYEEVGDVLFVNSHKVKVIE